MSFEEIDRMMRHAVDEEVFPGGALIFSTSGKVLFSKVYGYANIFTKQRITHETFFDLASLTKPLATTLAVMSLVQKGELGLEQTLGSIITQLSKTSKSDIRIRDLLRHDSGLPAYQPYFSILSQFPYVKRKSMLRDSLGREALISDNVNKTTYSDIGFMFLEWVVETITGLPLDSYIYKAVYEPMGVTDLFFINLENALPDFCFAATELCQWRRCLIQGVVHDENAFVMGGVAGHAGLFGTAHAVHRVLSYLMQSYITDDRNCLFKSNTVRLFLEHQADSHRALGFDIPSETDSSCGDLFRKDMTVGHLGFTGTSFWMELYRSIIIILLTNRIHPSRHDERIRKFRPLLHNAIMSRIVSLSGA